MSKVTLEQWRMLKAVVDHGGFAQASAAIHKSQSTINYAVNKLQAQLGVSLLQLKGRKAVLTEYGQLLLRRAEQLLSEAGDIEALAGSMGKGAEPVIRLAVDAVFPSAILFEALDRFSALYPYTQVELHETVLSGSNDAYMNGEVDLCVTGILPPGCLGDQIIHVEFTAVAHPLHPLHAMGRALTQQDLRQHRQVVVRDSSVRQRHDAGWLGAEQRWTVSHMGTSLEVVRRGLGYAWLPLWWVDDSLKAGKLKELLLEEGQRRDHGLFLLRGQLAQQGGPVDQLAELLVAMIKPGYYQT